MREQVVLGGLAVTAGVALAVLLLVPFGALSYRRRGGFGAWRFVVVMSTGHTVGDLAVQLRYTGGPLPIGLARFLRFAGGIGGYLVLLALPGAWGLVAGVFAVASVTLVLTTPDRRGLPGIMSGQRLVDARASADSL